jgi:hypothetical protein
MRTAQLEVGHNLLYCKEISIYVFLEKELRGLSPNFHIHVIVSDLYISTIGPPIFLQQNGTVSAQYLFWVYFFRIVSIVSLQCALSTFPHLCASSAHICTVIYAVIMARDDVNMITKCHC